MVNFAPLQKYPDLIFGLVGPIGADLEYIEQALKDHLTAYRYQTFNVKLTSLMREIKCDINIDDVDVINEYNSKMDYANDLRRKFDSNEILAAVAIAAVKRLRPADDVDADDVGASEGSAFIIRQLKTPEEVQLLRSVYGRLFIQISVYGAPSKREDRLTASIKIRSKGSIEDTRARAAARMLIDRDQKENHISYGQNVNDTFPLGDVFIDSFNRAQSNFSIDRFLNALFGSNEISPTKEEYGMYLAKMASLRSSDLSRQVGAAIFSKNGEVITLGSNEVPRAGGGTYWTGDPYDARDIMIGYDPNELNKNEIFYDLIKRLADDSLLNDDLNKKEIIDIISFFNKPDIERNYKKSRIMDLLEFGRIIHAEMSAICDASRTGRVIRDAILYCTTFPCHMCAKHIVASGISEVVYLEPYPKSYAEKLHGDAIQIETDADFRKVIFRPFIGISPLRYRDLFERGRRKDKFGTAQKWSDTPRRPNIPVIFPVHREAENYAITKLTQLISEQ